MTDSATFEILCPLSATVTEDAWTDTSKVFDLLQDTKDSIALPSISVGPSDCFTVTWQAFREGDDSSDIVSTNPSIFTLDPSGLNFCHDPTDFAQRSERSALSGDYYFQGTINDADSTKTSKFKLSCPAKLKYSRI